jgi:hypothetical protein
MKAGGKLTEILGAGIFALATGNIAVYTVRCFKETYSRPPLRVWQEGAGEKPNEKNQTPQQRKEAEQLKKKEGGERGKLVEKLTKIFTNPGGYIGEQIGGEIAKDLGIE